MLTPEQKEGTRDFMEKLKEEGTLKGVNIMCPFCKNFLYTADMSYDANAVSHVKTVSRITDQKERGYIEKKNPVNGKLETFCRRCGKQLGEVTRNFRVNGSAIAMAVVGLIIFIIVFAVA